MRRGLAAVALALLACTHSSKVKFGEKGAAKGPATPAETSAESNALYKPPAGATVRCRITFRDTMTQAFVFRRWQGRLDGALLYSDDEDSQIASHVNDGQPVHVDVDVTPGEHTIQSTIEYVGSGVGDNAYLTGYRFEIRTSRSFKATAPVEIEMIGYEQNPSGPIEERPAVRYVERPHAPSK
jgi:hypothetical protein